MLKPIHELAKSLPASERYELASQIRRASRSIPANIAEGYARRRSPREFCSFLAVAVGSANEMEVHLETAREFEYLSAERCRELVDEYRTIGKQLTRLIQYWQTRPPLADHH